MHLKFYSQYYKNVFESYGLGMEAYWIPLHEDNAEAAFDPLVVLKVHSSIEILKKVLKINTRLY